MGWMVLKRRVGAEDGENSCLGARARGTVVVDHLRHGVTIRRLGNTLELGYVAGVPFRERFLV
jgi:hypothetical protein